MLSAAQMIQQMRWDHQDAAHAELRMAAYYVLRVGDRAAADDCLRRAARHARRVMASVHRYCPEEYPTIGWYYETRDRIVELMQASAVEPRAAA